MTSLKRKNEHEGLASGSSETSTTIIWCERMMAATTSSSRVERSLTPREGGLNVRNVADEIASATKTKGFHRVKLGARAFLVSLLHIFIFNSAHFCRTQWSTQLQQIMDFFFRLRWKIHIGRIIAKERPLRNICFVNVAYISQVRVVYTNDILFTKFGSSAFAKFRNRFGNRSHNSSYQVRTLHQHFHYYSFYYYLSKKYSVGVAFLLHAKEKQHRVFLSRMTEAKSCTGGGESPAPLSSSVISYSSSCFHFISHQFFVTLLERR